MTAFRMCCKRLCATTRFGDNPAPAGTAEGVATPRWTGRLMPVVALLCLLLTFSIAGFAQSTSGGIVGTVTDPTGAVVPDAKLTAINVGTGVQLSAATNQKGDYSLYPLAPGNYDVVVEKSGFSSTTLQGVVIDVDTKISRNFVLKVGSTTSEVTVSASAAPLVTQSISMEGVVDQEQLGSLPLKNRDWNDLVLLTPGATDNTAATNINLDFGSYSLNGNRAFSNEYLVDGVPNNNTFQGKVATQMAVDSIAEFKVISGVPTAEYGHAATAITSVTKSGTNKIHGSLYNYYRGNELLAKNPFNRTGGDEDLLRNQFGGSLGGPISIPHLIDGRGKTFFFANYEGMRQNRTVARINTVPLAPFWTGDFSYLLSPEYNADPTKRIQLRDPFTTGRPNIPNNRLDLYKNGALLSPTALALRAYFAEPNQSGLSSNSSLFPEETTNTDQFSVRIDQSLPNNQSLSGRLTYHNSGGFYPNFLATPGVGMSEPQNSRNGYLTWIAPIGTGMVNEVRVGAMNYSDIVTYISGDAPTVDSLGMVGFDPAGDGIPPLPRITFSGSDAFSTIKYGPDNGYGEAALSMTTNVFSFADTVALNKGNHSFKFGLQVLRDYFNVLQQTNARGQITFSGSKSSSNSTGYSFADFLLGLPSSTQQYPVKAKTLLTENEFAGFFQDTWHIKPNLTLDLGVRYELSPSPSEVRDRLAMFTDKIPGGGFVVACNHGQLPMGEFLPSVIAKLVDANGNLTYPIACGSEYGYNAHNLVDTGKNNWAPRVGFIWDPTSKGVYSVHGGYGMVYSRYPVQYFLQTMLVNPPFAGLFPYSQKITGLTATGGGVPAITLTSPYSGTGKATVSPLGIDKNFLLPSNQQWNLGVARQMGSKMMMAVSYVGNKGTHLFRTFNVNQRIVDPETGAVITTYSTLFGTSNIPIRRSDGNSIYNAMVVEFRRRTSKNVNFGANWTWAKSIDDVSTNVQTAGLDILSPGRDRADSDYARRHTISFNSTYNLPFGKGRTFGTGMPRWANAVAGGWVMSGIWHWSTGRFMTASSTAQGGLSSNRPDSVPGISPNLPRSERTIDHWFNVDAFQLSPIIDPESGLPRFGNAGRNTIIGPGLNSVDMSLRKVFRLSGEKGRLSVEMSLFNVFNHPNWGNPDTNISNTNTVGKVSGLSKDMRLAQFSARYDF